MMLLKDRSWGHVLRAAGTIEASEDIEAARMFHRQIRRVVGFLIWVLLCAASGPGRASADDLNSQVASLLVSQVVKLVEERALRPKDMKEFEMRKKELLDAVEGSASISRNALYGRVRALLATLDTDGHTIIWSQNERLQFAASSPPATTQLPSVVQAVETANGVALILSPPPATSIDESEERAYAEGLVGNLLRFPQLEKACALVLDLTGQTGGSAWPPLAVIGTLLTPSNRAKLVDRDGRRYPLASPDRILGNRQRLLGPSAPDPLGRFRGNVTPVLVGSTTASAGETLVIALMGEQNVRTFGSDTYGATTANVPVSLPDNATLLLTTFRYAIGDAPPLRGPIRPDEILLGDATHLAYVLADWATLRSPLCKPNQAFQRTASPPVN